MLFNWCTNEGETLGLNMDEKHPIILSTLKCSLVKLKECFLNVPLFLFDAFNLLYCGGIKNEGIFHKPGNMQRIENMKCPFYGEFCLPEGTTIYDVCFLIKQFFRQLEEPLLTEALERQFLHFQKMDCETTKISCVLELCHILPPMHRETLAYLMLKLQNVARYSEHNKMDAKNLALAFVESIFSNNSSFDPLANVEEQMQKQMQDNEAKANLLELLINNAETIAPVSEYGQIKLPDKYNKCIPKDREWDAHSNESAQHSGHIHGMKAKTFPSKNNRWTPVSLKLKSYLLAKRKSMLKFCIKSQKIAEKDGNGSIMTHQEAKFKPINVMQSDLAEHVSKFAHLDEFEQSLNDDEETQSVPPNKRKAPNPVDCRVCGKSCCTTNFYRKHFKKHHPEYILEDMYDNGWKCEHCPDVFQKLNGLQKHWIKQHYELYSNEIFKDFAERASNGVSSDNCELLPEHGKQHFNLTGSGKISGCIHDVKTQKFLSTNDCSSPESLKPKSSSLSKRKSILEYGAVSEKNVEKDINDKASPPQGDCPGMKSPKKHRSSYLVTVKKGSIMARREAKFKPSDEVSDVADHILNIVRSLKSKQSQNDEEGTQSVSLNKQNKYESVDCQVCGMTCCSTNFYQKHLKVRHPEYILEDMHDDHWKCECCSDVFQSLISLQKHWIRQHNETYSKEVFSEFVKRASGEIKSDMYEKFLPKDQKEDDSSIGDEKSSDRIYGVKSQTFQSKNACSTSLSSKPKTFSVTKRNSPLEELEDKSKIIAVINIDDEAPPPQVHMSALKSAKKYCSYDTVTMKKVSTINHGEAEFKQSDAVQLDLADHISEIASSVKSKDYQNDEEGTQNVPSKKRKKPIPFKCRLCGINCCDLTVYRRHFKKMHAEFSIDDMFDNSWKCDQCFQVFQNLIGLRKHWILQHNELYSKEMFERLAKRACGKEDSKLFSEGSLFTDGSSNVETIVETDNDEAPTPQIDFPVQKSERNHRSSYSVTMEKVSTMAREDAQFVPTDEQTKIAHSVEEGGTKNVSHTNCTKPNSLICRVCGVTCCSTDYYHKHFREHHPEWKCDRCSLYFQSEISLKMHWIRQHNESYSKKLIRDFAEQSSGEIYSELSNVSSDENSFTVESSAHGDANSDCTDAIEVITL